MNLTLDFWSSFKESRLLHTIPEIDQKYLNWKMTYNNLVKPKTTQICNIFVRYTKNLPSKYGKSLTSKNDYCWFQSKHFQMKINNDVGELLADCWSSLLSVYLEQDAPVKSRVRKR